MIAVGDAVEVAGLAEAGCPQCWLVGSIVDIQQPVGAATVPMLTVALRQGDEPCIEEWHPSASLRVRPALPASLVAGDINEYQVGEPGAAMHVELLNGATAANWGAHTPLPSRNSIPGGRTGRRPGPSRLVACRGV